MPVSDWQLLYGLPRGMPRSSGPIYVPDGWGQSWLRARGEAAAGERLAVVGMFGDSIGKGSSATPSEWHFGWPGLLRSYLQARHGDGGSGFVSPDLSDITATGSWTKWPRLGQPSRGGPGGVTWQPTTPGSGATVTFPVVRGSTVTPLFKTAPGYGTFNVSVDGGADQPVNLNAAVSVLSFPITGLGAGPHSVRITATTGNGEIYGVAGRNPAGVILDNYSGGGATITNVNFGLLTPTVSGTGNYATDSLAAMGPCDAAIFALGVNDAIGTPPSLETLSDTIQYLVARIIDQGATDPLPPDLIFVIEHGGKADTLLGDTNIDYHQIASEIRSYAVGAGAAVVDVWADGRRSWKYWEQLGYWGSNNTDAVHPNNAGHAAYYELVKRVFDF